MTTLAEIAAFADRLLEARRFEDYCPNGVHVEGLRPVRRVLSGVTACLALIEEAVARDADALLVHHGYFWRNEPPALTGMKARRLRRLLESGIGLLAYHLPLDAHPELGNNAQLAKRLGLRVTGALDDDRRAPIAMRGELESPCAAGEFRRRIGRALAREPLWVDGGGDGVVRTVGWCTGAAQDYLEYAVRHGLDAFISGEISERTTHIAREEGVHYYAAGHHATERYGVQALGERLAREFALEHVFVDLDNPA